MDLTQFEQEFKINIYETGPDGKYGRHIASASSSWLIIDRTSGRIKRPDDILTGFNSPVPTGNSLTKNAEKIEPASDYGLSSDLFKVKISDLDINLHTNNVIYIKWVTDTYDLDFTMNHTPVSLEINYLAESICGEKVFIRTSEEKNNGCFYNHSFIRNVDNKELCRVRMEWNCREHKEVDNF